MHLKVGSRASQLKAKQAKGKSAVEGLATGMDTMQIEARFNQKMKEAMTDEERRTATKEMENDTNENA